MLWNATLTPSTEVSADYIQSSLEYIQLRDSLVASWKGIGADFNE